MSILKNANNNIIKNIKKRFLIIFIELLKEIITYINIIILKKSGERNYKENNTMFFKMK